jgi:UrcA family protein
MTTSKLVLAALGAATLTATSVPAFAAGEQGKSVEVQYSDLDLTTPAGAKELDRRLHEAAREVCGMSNMASGSRLRSDSAGACYRDALKQLQARFAGLLGKKQQQG